MGVQTYCLPSRVRSDHGLENVKVAQFMIEQKSTGRGSMITGSSAHNSRVERAHRDIYAGVLSFFAKTFHELEESGQLDPLVELDIFALHYVYVPRISTALKEFQEQWNHIGTDYGVHSEDPCPVEDEDYQVAVPEILTCQMHKMNIYATPVIHCKMMAILVKTFSHNVQICFLMLFICDEKGRCKSKEHCKNKTDTAYILIQFIFVYHHIVASK